VANDNVSLTEDTPNGYDAQTTITVDAWDLKWIEEKLTVYPNPASGDLKVTVSNPPCGMYAIELVGMNGAKYHSRIYDDFSLSQGVPVDLKNCSPGQYVVRVAYGNNVFTKKIAIN
jgi:hypothetical protein